MKYNLEFSPEELNAIANAIAEMPYKIAQPLMNTIQEQVNQQQQQPEFEEMPEGAQVQ